MNEMLLVAARYCLYVFLFRLKSFSIFLLVQFGNIKRQTKSITTTKATTKLSQPLKWLIQFIISFKVIFRIQD